MNHNRELLYIRIYRAAPLLLFLVVWELLARRSTEFTYFFGRPSKVISYLVWKTADFSLPNDFALTFVEVLAGFVLGNLLGTIIGLSLWYSKPFSKLQGPTSLL
jgi:NitT/TauT family transport system permease protein